jgi:addiction module RelE/StbE family toxin
MYKILLSKSFLEDYKGLSQKNIVLKNKILRAIELLSKDPFYPSLKSHKVYARNIGSAWSSRVSGDIRIIWEYNERNQLWIDALAIGSHTGKDKVYD